MKITEEYKNFGDYGYVDLLSYDGLSNEEILVFYTNIYNGMCEWSREALINWLCWNDRNGEYTDEDSEHNGWEPLSKESALEIIHRQLVESI